MEKEQLVEQQNIVQDFEKMEHPRVFINACSHGNEILGLQVLDLLKLHTVKKGSVFYNVGNPKALQQNKRYIDSDLNRVFPGKSNGDYEERLAFHLTEVISHFDYVIDIHSTVSGMENCTIIEDDSLEVQKMISACRNVATVLHMSVTKDSSIFTATRLPTRTIPALAFEYGGNDYITVEKTYKDISNILSSLGTIDYVEEKYEVMKPNQLECYDVYPKDESDIHNPKVENYRMVHKGDIIGYTETGESIFSDSDFYPVLFGETNYTTIFGFKARKL